MKKRLLSLLLFPLLAIGAVGPVIWGPNNSATLMPPETGFNIPPAGMILKEFNNGPGSIAVSTGANSVAGIGTQFTKTFTPKDTIAIGSQSLIVSSIPSDTSLLTTTNWASTSTGQNYTTGAPTRFSFLANGSVGFGITPVDANFEIAKTGNVSGFLTLTGYGTNPSIVQRRSTSATVGTLSATGAVAIAGWNGGTTDGTGWSTPVQMVFRSDATQTATSHPAFIEFFTTAVDSTTATERLRITSAGNMGVKNTAPAHTLDVTGDAAFSGGIVGVTDGSASSTTGSIGEFTQGLVSTLTGWPAGNGSWGDTNCIVTVTAGDWNLTGVVEQNANGGTMISATMGISTTAGNSASGLTPSLNSVGFTAGTGVTRSGVIPNYRVSSASSASYYLKLNSSWSVGTPTYTCRLSASRAR